jgi:Divergent InlB B-repeat domain
MRPTQSSTGKLCRAALLTVLALTATVVRAQLPSVVNIPTNFDVFNNTGADVNGLEVEVDGITQFDISETFGKPLDSKLCFIRYCEGQLTAFPGGVFVRWAGPFNGTTFATVTPPANGTVAPGESCTTALGARYSAAGCEHFGFTATKQPTRVVYRWLVIDPQNPAQLTYYTGGGTSPVLVPVPQPAINILPPAPGSANVQVAFDVTPLAPAAPTQTPTVPQFGDAQWVKVYKSEQASEVTLNQLLGGNPVVPEAPAPAETEWVLMQFNPANPTQIIRNVQTLSDGFHAVVRRYEVYLYTGQYDPNTHQALCGDGICAAPQTGEVGSQIGSQNIAANLEVPSVSIVPPGNLGSIVDAGGLIACGSLCSADVPFGTQITLTASPASNATFFEWGGACHGAQPTCVLTVNGALSVEPIFNPISAALTVQVSGHGTVAASPRTTSGSFLSCSSQCSVQFQEGTAVTFTATPAAGSTFQKWGGACSGTAPTCTVTVNQTTRVQAAFK